MNTYRTRGTNTNPIFTQESQWSPMLWYLSWQTSWTSQYSVCWLKSTCSFVYWNADILSSKIIWYTRQTSWSPHSGGSFAYCVLPPSCLSDASSWLEGAAPVPAISITVETLWARGLVWKADLSGSLPFLLSLGTNLTALPSISFSFLVVCLHV